MAAHTPPDRPLRAARRIPVRVHHIGTAVDRDEILGRVRTPYDDRTDYLVAPFNMPVRVRRSDGTWHTVKGVS